MGKVFSQESFPRVTEASASSSPRIPRGSRRTKRDVAAQDPPIVETQETTQEEEEERDKTKKQKKD